MAASRLASGALGVLGPACGSTRRLPGPRGERSRAAEGADPWAAGRGRASVVIPAYEEERRIAMGLGALAAVPGIDEVIVVDGGSSDRTVEIAGGFPGVRVLSVQRGRALQMNAGAAAARGEIIVFLHVDVSLPLEARAWIDWALAGPGVVAGAFRTLTVAGAGSPRPRLEPFLRLADLRSRYTRLPYGDQALFVRADAFRRAGGFPEIPLMEDLELARRLARVGRIRTVPAAVRVSGRRFLARPVFYTLVVNLFPVLYRLGVSPERLARLYGDPR